MLFIVIMGRAVCESESDDKLAPSVLVFILLDVRQAASTFHDSLAKISEKALSSGGTKRVILEYHE